MAFNEGFYLRDYMAPEFEMTQIGTTITILQSTRNLVPSA